MQLSRVLLLVLAAVVLSLSTCLATGKVVHLGHQGTFAKTVADGPLFVKLYVLLALSTSSASCVVCV
jgi:hypothetical protein